MKWIIRHSKKMNEIEFKKTDRYKDNKFDTLLEKGSKSIAINTIKNICNIDKSIKSIQYIYSSPFTRTLETAIIFQNYLKKYNENIKIRIEYGLEEINANKYIQNLYKYRVVKNGKIMIKDKKDVIYTDKTMKLNELIKKYGNIFDTTYKSKILYKDVKYLYTNFIDNWNDKIKTMKYIDNLEKKNSYLIVSHGNTIKYLLIYFLNKIDYNIENKMGWDNWCISFAFNDKNKLKHLLND